MDPYIKDVRYMNGVNGEFLIIEHSELNEKINISITDFDCKSIIRAAMSRI